MDNRLIREAVAVFDDSESLERTVSELQSNGIDRSSPSFLAHASPTEGPSGGLQHLADHPATPREAPVTDPDLRQGRILGTSLAATIAGFAAAGFTVATGGVAAALAAALAAGGVGAVGALIGRKLGENETTFLDAQLARGGVLLWVRTRDRAAERRAIEVLRRHAAHVHLHDLTAEPRPEGSVHSGGPRLSAPKRSSSYRTAP
jgi:hypothetical protein